MNNILKMLLILICSNFLPEIIYAQSNGGDVLNETPFYVVPADMTFEEYEDANRRLSVGLLLMSIPFPGSLHFYANERREAWKHVGVAAVGILSIAIGAGASDEKTTWPASEFQTIDITGDDGTVRRYEKIPSGFDEEFENEFDSVNYELKLLRHDRDGGEFLIVLGAGLLIGQLIHDWYDGIRTIEKKRNRVRFNYGKKSNLGFNLLPQIDPANGLLGAKLSIQF